MNQIKNRLLIYIVIAVVAVVGAAFAITRNQKINPSVPTPAQSHRSYSIKSQFRDLTYSPDKSTDYFFSIVDDRGSILKDFLITHTKIMHVIVVRTDLKYFQHLHPEFDEYTGKFALPSLTFPADGHYRIFADFVPREGQKDPAGNPLPVTISSEAVVVGFGYSRKPIGSEERTKIFDDIEVALQTRGPLISGVENMLMFALSQGNKPVTNLEEYLGALGHSVLLREGTLDFIHTHPVEVKSQDGTVNFMVTFPQPGKYKVFTQFQKNGKIITTDFVISVAQGQNTPLAKPAGMEHTRHP